MTESCLSYSKMLHIGLYLDNYGGEGIWSGIVKHHGKARCYQHLGCHLSAHLPLLSQTSGTFTDFPACLLTDTLSYQADRPHWTVLWLLVAATLYFQSSPQDLCLVQSPTSTKPSPVLCNTRFHSFPSPRRFPSICPPVLPFQEPQLHSHRRSLHHQFVGCLWQTMNFKQNTA